MFDFDDGTEYVGGDRSPIVIRKSDSAALNYADFFNLDADAEDVGDAVSKATFRKSVPAHAGMIPATKFPGLKSRDVPARAG